MYGVLGFWGSEYEGFCECDDEIDFRADSNVALYGEDAFGPDEVYYTGINSWGHKLRRYATPVSNRGGKF
jgi:hypothetical protein